MEKLRHQRAWMAGFRGRAFQHPRKPERVSML